MVGIPGAYSIQLLYPAPSCTHSLRIHSFIHSQFTLTFHQFRRHVLHGAAESRHARRGNVLQIVLREAKVRQHHVPVDVHQHVFQLQVAVHHLRDWVDWRGVNQNGVGATQGVERIEPYAFKKHTTSTFTQRRARLHLSTRAALRFPNIIHMKNTPGFCGGARGPGTAPQRRSGRGCHMIRRRRQVRGKI